MAINLVIAEKKLVADAIAAAIGINPKSNKGFIQCDNFVITWCVGHLLELAQPHHYKENLKKWNIETLPFYFRDVEKLPIARTKDQFNILINLMKKADCIYHCGDPDDEGQLIIDEMLDYTKFNKAVKRVIINDNNPELIAKAFNKAEDNSKYRHLGYMALARSSSDWHFGLNLSRAYTVIEQKKGSSELITVGRVQDVVKGLVVRRCRDIANFMPKDFFVVNASLMTQAGEKIRGRYINELNPNLVADLDDEKRIVIEEHARKTVEMIAINNSFRVIDIAVENKTKQAPLPYNLLKLQVDMSRKYDISLDETLEITQSLRDKYNAITYNRSDCQYLNDETFEESPRILEVIAANAPIFNAVVSRANSSIKSRCFNSKKVSAHHAIIPTFDKFDFNKLSDKEQKCYLLISRAFIAQFYPLHKYDLKIITISNSKGDTFILTIKTIVDEGWLKLYKNDSGNEESEDSAAYSEVHSNISINDIIVVSEPLYETKQTQPPKYYTEDTLANELTRVARYIKNEELRKIMVEKDKDKAGEHGGVGTPATRSTIVKELFNKGFLIKDKKNIIATDKAHHLYDKLPDNIKYPDLTALWHSQMKDIRTLEDAKDFVQQVMRPIAKMIVDLKSEYNSIEVENFSCPECEKELKRYNGKNGYFWSCVGYKDKSCKYSCTDLDNAPTFEKPVFNSNTIRKNGKKKF